MASAGTDCVLGTPPKSSRTSFDPQGRQSAYGVLTMRPAVRGFREGRLAARSRPQGRVVLRQQPPVPVLAKYKSLLTPGAHKQT